MNPFNKAVEAGKEYGLGSGEYLKIKEGDNRIRILSESIPHESEFNGKKSVKFVTWVLDRKDGVVKPYFMPFTIVKTLAALGDDPDWAFETLPMPYDINIKAINAGTLDVEYSVIASPKQTSLTADEEKAFAERLPVEEFVAKLAEKDKKPAPPQPSKTVQETTSKGDDVNVEDIPF